MKWLLFLCSAGLILGLMANQVPADETQEWHPSGPLPLLRSNPNCLPAPAPPGCPAPATPATPSTSPTQPDQPTPAQPQASDAFAQSPEAGSQVAGSFDPGVFGDLIGSQGQRILAVPGSAAAAGLLANGNRVAVAAPLPYRGTFKISENESPLPTDRVFFNYNYFDNVTHGTPFAVGSANLDRETVGFEKTFLGGDGSFGMRLPFLQLTGNDLIDQSVVGDLSLVFKYALINDRENNNVLSAGMVLTVPTGPAIDILGESDVNSVVFQPFAGFIYHFNRDLFVQGFSSLAVPTDERDVTLLFNSLAAGYYLCRDSSKEDLLQSIVPVAELHLNTPLNHRGADTLPIGYPDALDATLGCYFNFSHATLGTAIGFPLTGPKPYNVEATVSLNIRF